MPSLGTCLQVLAHVVLLFFVIPIQIRHPIQLETLFREYLEQFNKSYNASEYQRRLEAFQKSLESIDELNANRSEDAAKYGLTKFSDMLPEEFRNHHLKSNLDTKLSRNFLPIKTKEKRSIVQLPKSIDWRKKHVIGKIKNQGSCGACWAFSGVETIESMNAIKTGKFEELSVQEVIDCALYNDGCEGGDTCNMLFWMKSHNISLQFEKDYPFQYRTNRCSLRALNVKGVQLKQYSCENLVGEEEMILDLLANNGPVAVAINAQTWQNYIGGVIEFHCNGDISDLNHAVQIVGYDLNAKIPYYVVRNTWGDDFGDSGYLYLAVGKNICGLANEVSAVIV